MLGYLQFPYIDNRIQRSKWITSKIKVFFSNSNKQCALGRDSEKPFRKGILILSFIKRSILSLHNLVVRLSVVVGSWIPPLIESRECSQGSPREGVSCSLINIVFYGERRQSICRVRPRTLLSQGQQPFLFRPLLYCLPNSLCTVYACLLIF